MLEIERKFLITSETFKKEAFKSTRIVQGFLNTHPERTVRIRVKGDQGFITVKGKSNDAGTVRLEWENEITIKEAEMLLELCEECVIEKIRYEIKIGDHIFEVDEFFGKNEGLTVAEVELTSEDEDFGKPAWLGEEVTGQIKYYNSQLSKEPFNTW